MHREGGGRKREEKMDDLIIANSRSERSERREGARTTYDPAPAADRLEKMYLPACRGQLGAGRG
jgi:hypothetical protein